MQGTSSAFGRWLDQVLDELADLALHAAIAWAAFVRDGQPVWLILGMLYRLGKVSVPGPVAARETSWRAVSKSRPGQLGLLRATARYAGSRALDRALAVVTRLLGHADLRWHLWIVLALAGRLDLALAVYAAYFPARALAGAVRKGVRYA